MSGSFRAFRTATAGSSSHHAAGSAFRSVLSPSLASHAAHNPWRSPLFLLPATGCSYHSSAPHHKAAPPFKLSRKSTSGKPIHVKNKFSKGKQHIGHRSKRDGDVGEPESVAAKASPDGFDAALHQISSASENVVEYDPPTSPETREKVNRDTPPHVSGISAGAASMAEVARGCLNAKEINLQPVDDGKTARVAILRKSLQRVPFNPGVQYLRDPRTGVWNYEQDCLHSIPHYSEYAYHRQAPYYPPGTDPDLQEMAAKTGSRYLGSTSTLTKAFSQIYFTISGDRALDFASLSNAFVSERTDFTAGARLPAVLNIGKSDNGSLYIDSDKTYDIPNVLSEYGHMLERMLTSEPADFRRYLKSSPEESVSQAEREDRGAFQYQKGASLLMRSQLDCYDPRLPGTGVFDIKTRACLSLRHDRANYEAAKVYDINQEKGFYNSYEREYFDLIKSAMLKFTMQVRIGMMDGIFVAYHNTDRIFGFQYLPLSEMDERLFGSSEMGDSAFRLCVALFEALLDEVTQAFPDQKVRVALKQTQPRSARTVTAFVQPENWEGDAKDTPTQAFALTIKSKIDGEAVNGAVGFSVDEATRKQQVWEVDYTITKSSMDPESQAHARKMQSYNLQDLLRMMTLNLPEGKTASDMANSEIGEGISAKWRRADGRVKQVRQLAKESGEAYQRRLLEWGESPGKSWEFIER